MKNKGDGKNKRFGIIIFLVIISCILIGLWILNPFNHAKLYERNAIDYLLTENDIEGWDMVNESHSIHMVPPTALSDWQRDFKYNDIEELRIRIIVFDSGESAHNEYEGVIQDLETVYHTPMQNYSIGTEGSTGLYFNPYDTNSTTYYYVIYSVNNVHVMLRGAITDSVQSSSYRSIAQIQLEKIVGLK